jgi:hypothetical protein
MAKGKPPTSRQRNYRAEYESRVAKAQARGYDSYYHRRKHREIIKDRLTEEGKKAPKPSDREAWDDLERRLPRVERSVTIYRSREQLEEDMPGSETRKIAPFKADAIEYIKTIAGAAYFIILEVDIDGEIYYQPYFNPDPAVQSGWDPVTH